MPCPSKEVRTASARAVEHAAVAGPTASLLAPDPTSSDNLSTATNTVFIRGQSPTQFSIQLSDGTGPGVYDASVVASEIDVVEDAHPFAI